MPAANSTNTAVKTVMCFDIGLQRTGVAVGQRLTNSAQPVGQINGKSGQLDWIQLEHLLKEWQPELIVLGDPKTTNTHLNKLINRFKSHIQQQHKIPIIEVDERLSSAAANNELVHSKLGVRQKTHLRDQIAACLILESYFNSLINNLPDDHK